MAVEPNRWGIIYNPKAGSRKAQKRWAKIREYMDSQNVMYDYVQSEGFGSVERLARTLANNGYKTIVVVGGDGAINDAVNGIMHSDVEDVHEIAFGIIPNGIGNDFAKYWGLDSDDYKGAVDVLINRRLRKVDLGVFEYYNGDEHINRYFLNAVYMGLGAKIAEPAFYDKFIDKAFSDADTKFAVVKGGNPDNPNTVDAISGAVFDEPTDKISCLFVPSFSLKTAIAGTAVSC